MATAGRVAQSVIEQVTLQNRSSRVAQSIIEFITSLGITCDNPPAGTVGVPYTHTFPAGSGQTPYTFSIASGSLPSGLSLNGATGTVSGTPTVGGTYAFTVQVTDALGAVAQVTCSITIAQGSGGTSLSIALYGYKRIKYLPVCADPLEEMPDLPPVKRVL